MTYRKKLLINCFIILSFLVISIFSISLIWGNGTLYFTRGDSFFHLGRAVELLRSNKYLPGYAFNSFNDVGSAVMTFYPYAFLYPLAFLLKLFSLKYALLGFYLLGSTLAAIISYFSSLRLSQSRWVSYLFAIIYTFSGEFMAASFYSHVTDIGVYLSSIFIPLVIFGFVAYLRNGKWLMLSIGMSAIIFSNLISAVFIAVALLILLSMNLKLFTARRQVNLIKAMALTIITTAIVWLPILSLSLSNSIYIPTIKRVGLVNLHQIFYYSIRNQFTLGCQSMTVYSLLGLIVGLLLIKRMPKIMKQLYGLAILIIFISSDLFPWRWLLRSQMFFRLMVHLQTTIRLLVIPQMILEFILAYGVIKLLRDYLKRWVELALLIALVATQIQCQVTYIDQGTDLVTQGQGVTSSRQIMTQSLKVQKVDYWPEAFVSAPEKPFNHHLIPKGQGKYELNVPNNNRRITLPILNYYGINYQCRLDGKLIPIHSNRNQLMVLNDVGPGMHNLQIQVMKSRVVKIAEVVSTLSILIYMWAIYERVVSK